MIKVKVNVTVRLVPVPVIVLVKVNVSLMFASSRQKSYKIYSKSFKILFLFGRFGKICRISREATPYTELTLTYNNLKLNFENCNLLSEKLAIFGAELGKNLIN